MRNCSIVCLSAVLLAGCASSPEVAATAFWIPVMTAEADRDRHETDGDLRFDADLRTGAGFGTRIALEEGDGGLGILYLTTRHSERQTGARVRTHSAYLEYLATIGWREDPPFLYGRVGAGVGGAVFDFDREFHDTGSAAGLLRVEAGAALLRFLRIHAGGGGYLWGYPGETIGTGAFVLLGLTVGF